MKKIIGSFFVSIFILTCIGIYLFTSIHKYKDESKWVNHTYEVLSDAQNAISSLQDIESSCRGYVITGKANYLDRYHVSLARIGSTYDHLKYLTRDNFTQQLRLDSIHELFQTKIDFAKKVILLRGGGTPDAAKELVATDAGENTMKQIQATIKRFTANENNLLAARLKKTEERFSTVVSIIVLCIVISIISVIITFYFFIFFYKRQMDSEKKVVQSERLIKSFLETLPVGVFIVRTDGQPYYVNSKSTEILGKGISYDTRDQGISEIYQVYQAGTNVLCPLEKLPVSRALNGETLSNLEDLEIQKNGTRHPLRISATPVRNNENQIEYSIAVFEDITLEKQKEAELRNAKELTFLHQIESAKKESEIERLKNSELKLANQQIEKKNREILDSIEYAKYIQDTLLSSQEEINRNFSDSFILSRPKDIVSGDFYWHYKIADTQLLALADCTGHGVSGAFMTIVGNNLLERIADANKIHEPNLILQKLNASLNNTYKKSNGHLDVNSGMDIALCSIDFSQLKLKYAGTHSSIYIVRNKKLIEIKGDRITLGAKADAAITQQERQLEKGDILYLFSDGYVDQKGGELHKKFYYQPFQALILQVSSLTMSEQKQALDKVIDEWMTNEKQVDDITVIGVKIS